MKKTDKILKINLTTIGTIGKIASFIIMLAMQGCIMMYLASQTTLGSLLALPGFVCIALCGISWYVENIGNGK